VRSETSWIRNPWRQKLYVWVSPELFDVLSLFDRWRVRTGGALDAAAEAITRLWQTAASDQRLPTQAELDAALAAVRQVHWRLDAQNQTATHTSAAPLAMNSFVKSYIVGRSADAALRVTGVHGIVVNIGGDLVVRGRWSEPVDVADPESAADNAEPIAELLRALPQSVRIERVAFSQQAPPPKPTGQPPAAAAQIKPPSPGTPGAKPAAPAVSLWDRTYQLNINMEIAHIQGVHITRPFVAVWIEDPDRTPVRTLELWYGSLRYGSRPRSAVSRSSTNRKSRITCAARTAFALRLATSRWTRCNAKFFQRSRLRSRCHHRPGYGKVRRDHQSFRLHRRP
jgi:hypothetical protein